MDKSPKNIVQSFYNLDISKVGAEGYKEFLHPNCQLNWHSTRGFTKLGIEEILILLKDIATSYKTVRFVVSHILEDQPYVTTRYTIFVSPIEGDTEEVALAHFITIWEVKDGKLYKGFEISQSADKSEHSLNSYLKNE